jgi:hypothetical protein
VLAYTVDMTLGQLAGGYRTQPRVGATDTNQFSDAALRAGDSITVDGVIVTVNSLNTAGDSVTLRAASATNTQGLAVTRAGTGFGTVASSPAGINCTPTCIATYANGTSVSLTATPASGQTFTGWSGDCSGLGSCIVTMSGARNVTANFAASTVATTYTGLWWNAAESGWGMSLTQRGSIVFVAWYTYSSTGAPVWYVMSNCALVATSCTGEIFAVTGGRALTTLWNAPTLGVASVGTGTLTFTNADTGNFSFSLNGTTGTKSITRQPIVATGASPSPDFSGLYWSSPAASESGWGVSLTQQFGVMFIAMFTYDTNGAPIWYVASDCPVVGRSCSGALYQVNGGRAPTVAWGTPALNVQQVGSISFMFTEAGLGLMRYTINGVSGSRAITRQIF